MERRNDRGGTERGHARRSRGFYHEAALLDEWRLDEWQELLTEDAVYYVPPNDQPEGDHRTTLFLIADDRERIRQRSSACSIPIATPSFPTRARAV